MTRIVALDEVGSTNAVARCMADDGAAGGRVIIAEAQLAGRGRRGRTWHSPRGLGLYLSILLRPSRPVTELTRWTLAAAAAAATACRETSGVPVEIDWPNDLVVGRRKLGGVLAEMRSLGQEARDLIIGLGLNVNHEEADFPPPLRASATSLCLALGRRAPEREHLAAAYLAELGRLVARLEAGDWAHVARAWERLAAGCHGKRVRVAREVGPDPLTSGVTAGIDATGALRIRRDDGTLVQVGLGDSVVALEA